MSEPRPETESPDIEVVKEADAPAEATVPVPVPMPLPDSGSASASDPDDDEDDDSPLAALWSYETYEAVARKVLRAGTEVAREGYQRHDAAVVAVALALIVAGGVVHRVLERPPMEDFDAHGLHFRRTAHWLAPETVPPSPPRLIPGAPIPPRTSDLPFHEIFTSDLDPDARLEILVDKKPPWSNTLTALELERRNRYGELYSSDGGETRSIAGHDWLRTSFRYAYAPSKGDQPRIGHAVEYATVDREQLYAVTFHGSPSEIEYLEDTIAPTLRLQSRTGVPLIMQNRITAVKAPEPVRGAEASTVMVVVADLIDGRLRAVGGGSGVVVSPDGSIVTSHHVLVDKGTRLHDVFVIARSVGDSPSPQLVCAGRPRAAKFDARTDLALLKCEMDLDGRPWNPTYGAWVPIAAPPRHEVGLGERVWVIGYPDRGGGGITLSQGLVDGNTTDPVVGLAFKTDASITHGNSGGPVVDDKGNLVGLAVGFRVEVQADGKTVETADEGLVRPWDSIAKALIWAKTGWMPKLDDNSFDAEPDAVEVAPEGVLISTKVEELANGKPVPGAMLMVMKPGIHASDVDMNRLDDQVVAWGRANAEGEVHLKQPVPAPGTYSVVVVAPGYEPLAGDNALVLADDTPPYFDPWGVVNIKAAP